MKNESFENITSPDQNLETEELKKEVVEKSQAVINKIKKFIPADKDINLIYWTDLNRKLGEGRLLSNWDNSNIAEIGINLRDDLDYLEHQKNIVDILIAHEASHLFNSQFKEITTVLTDEEIEEAQDVQIGNPEIETGQIEVITDLTALNLDIYESKKQILEEYLNLVEDYLKNPEPYIRDDVRFREILMSLTDEGDMDMERALMLIAELEKRVKMVIGEDEKNIKYLTKYQFAIRKIIDFFKDNFAEHGQVEEYLKQRIE